MPRGDGTGPAGIGRLTGRGAGFCMGFKTPGYMSFIQERGKGFDSRRRHRRISWLVGLLPGCAYLAYRWRKSKPNEEKLKI